MTLKKHTNEKAKVVETFTNKGKRHNKKGPKFRGGTMAKNGGDVGEKRKQFYRT